MIIRPIIAYPLLIFAGIIGFSLGGSMATTSSRQDTLKLCNQKPLECKFKYDILMYNETGKVPYTEQKTTPQNKK